MLACRLRRSAKMGFEHPWQQRAAGLSHRLALAAEHLSQLIADDGVPHRRHGGEQGRRRDAFVSISCAARRGRTPLDAIDRVAHYLAGRPARSLQNINRQARFDNATSP